MSSKQYLVDSMTRHQIFLQRYASNESRNSYKTLLKMDAALVERLGAETSFVNRNGLLRDISNISKTHLDVIKDDLIDSSNKLVASEASFNSKAFTLASTEDFEAPTDILMINKLSLSKMKVGGGKSITIAYALDKFSAKKSDELVRIVNDGLLQGNALKEISNQLTKTIKTLHRRQADALTRTIVNHASSVARSVTYSNNSHLIEGYEYLATLDSRTTIVCAINDGETFDADDTEHLPPLHWNCRSSTVPVVKSQYDVGSKLKGKRASKSGPVGTETKYSGWLRRQPKAVVDEVLGPERSKLFRSRELTLDKFIDTTGKRYTLDDLARMNDLTLS